MYHEDACPYAAPKAPNPSSSRLLCLPSPFPGIPCHAPLHSPFAFAFTFQLKYESPSHEFLGPRGGQGVEATGGDEAVP